MLTTELHIWRCKAETNKQGTQVSLRGKECVIVVQKSDLHAIQHSMFFALFCTCFHAFKARYKLYFEQFWGFQVLGSFFITQLGCKTFSETKVSNKKMTPKPETLKPMQKNMKCVTGLRVSTLLFLTGILNLSVKILIWCQVKKNDLSQFCSFG